MNKLTPQRIFLDLPLLFVTKNFVVDFLFASFDALYLSIIIMKADMFLYSLIGSCSGIWTGGRGEGVRLGGGGTKYFESV